MNSISWARSLRARHHPCRAVAAPEQPLKNIKSRLAGLYAESIQLK